MRPVGTWVKGVSSQHHWLRVHFLSGLNSLNYFSNYMVIKSIQPQTGLVKHGFDVSPNSRHNGDRYIVPFAMLYAGTHRLQKARDSTHKLPMIVVINYQFYFRITAELFFQSVVD